MSMTLEELNKFVESLYVRQKESTREAEDRDDQRYADDRIRDLENQMSDAQRQLKVLNKLTMIAFTAIAIGLVNMLL